MQSKAMFIFYFTLDIDFPSNEPAEAQKKVI